MADFAPYSSTSIVFGGRLSGNWLLNDFAGMSPKVRKKGQEMRLEFLIMSLYFFDNPVKRRNKGS